MPIVISPVTPTSRATVGIGEKQFAKASRHGVAVAVQQAVEARGARGRGDLEQVARLLAGVVRAHRPLDEAPRGVDASTRLNSAWVCGRSG